MPEFNPNRIMHGNGGHAWFNGKKLTTLQTRGSQGLRRF